MDVSIVFGTYNRIKYLKDCVKSVRESVHGLEYEIIVVDGGSSDGSREWLIEQPDIVAICDRGLEGAIKAFNKGFRVAQGKYVVNLNDDLIVENNAIKVMFDYMQRTLKCGQGVFYFKLQDEKEYKYSKVFDKPYANFGMIRRVLGDSLGWWGNEYHTYGGDTELSVLVWRAGFTVDPVKDATVRDLLVHDELRRINYKNKDDRGQHKDTKKFWAKWGKKGLKVTDDKIGSLNILHVALNTDNDTQPALERALTSLGSYRQFDWRKNRQQLHERLLTEANHPTDLVFMQIQTDGAFNPQTLQRLKDKTDAFIINWNGDIRPTPQTWMGAVGAVADLTLITNKTQIPEYEQMGCKNVGYLQIGFNDEIYRPLEMPYERDVVWLGTNYGHFPLSKLREELIKKVSEMKNINFRIYGGGWPESKGITTHEEEAQLYWTSKIALGISAIDLECYTSDRLFRAMGSGAFYLTKWFPGIETMFENKKHLVWWKEIDECLELIKYYLAHENEREQIAAEGCKLVHERDTWDMRAKELMCLVKSYSPTLDIGMTRMLTTASS